MFKPSKEFQPKAETETTKCAIRSLINDAHLLSEHLWAVSIVRKRGTEHACLVIEGKKSNEYVIFRSDLFLDGSDKKSNLSIKPLATAIDFLFDVSQAIHGCGFIRLKELKIEELEELAKVSEYQSYGISDTDAEKLLRRLLEEGNKTVPYHMAGDHSTYSSSTSVSRHQNCVSWIQKVLKEVLNISIGNHWALINRPSTAVKQAIEQAKKCNSPSPHRP